MNYDLIVLGGGPGGYAGAICAAKEGLSVLLIERERLGGVCLNRGCIPTKSLLKSADVYYSAVNSATLGVSVGAASFDEDAIFKRKDEVVARLVDGVEKLVAAASVTVIRGEGRFLSSDTVEVNGETHTAKRIMLATGGRATMPPIPGANFALSSDDVLSGKARGEKIVIVGGGVIGVEFAPTF
jgi:Pyruvate/2-oxoglutarate dehydrogenase complex, dihydrolipoamide dehydrogenase (E3) component, and related enzymes